MLSNLWRGFLNSAARLTQSCVLCGVGGQGWLCPGCQADLPRLPAERCPQCGRPSRAGLVCGTCRQQPPAWDALVAAHPYAWPLDEVLHAFKYRRQLTLARPLAGLLHAAVAGRTRPDCLVPIPLSTARWQARGFNQSEELARRLAYDLALPCVSATLQRVRDTPAQAGLNRARRLENLRGAFTVHRPVTGQFIALIDDVSTTGATLAEAAQTLKQQGAARVEGWVLLRTPDNRA